MEELIGRSSCSVLAGPNCLPFSFSSFFFKLLHLSVSSSVWFLIPFLYFMFLSACLQTPPNHHHLHHPAPSLSFALSLSLSLLLVSPPVALSSHLLLVSNLPLVLGSMTCQWWGGCPCPRLIRQLIIQHFRHTRGSGSTYRQPHTCRTIWAAKKTQHCQIYAYTSRMQHTTN